jgi:uncharacterized protein
MIAPAGSFLYLGEMPVFYECERCAACCRWPGQVRLSETEITQLSSFLGLNEHDFIQNYTSLSVDRSGLVLQNKSNDECVFLDGIDCRVQSVKPQQCRAFPNLWNFPGFERVCKAIPVNVGQDEYHRRVAVTVGEMPE